MAGFRILKSAGSSPFNSQVGAYFSDSTHATLIAPGDVLKSTGTGDAAGNPQADTAAAGGAVLGILVARDPDMINENRLELGIPALEVARMMVETDPSVEYEVDVTGGALAVTDIGQNINIDATAATKNGTLTNSNMAVASGTKGAGATLQFKIIAIKEDNDGVLGNVAIVRVNNSIFKAGTAGV